MAAAAAVRSSDGSCTVSPLFLSAEDIRTFLLY
jgi:hypothetical protein